MSSNISVACGRKNCFNQSLELKHVRVGRSVAVRDSPGPVGGTTGEQCGSEYYNLLRVWMWERVRIVMCGSVV